MRNFTIFYFLLLSFFLEPLHNLAPAQAKTVVSENRSAVYTKYMSSGSTGNDCLQQAGVEIRSRLLGATACAENSVPARYIVSLETALHDYEKLATSGGWEAFPAGKSIKLNNQDQRVPTLRKILKTMGDNPDDAALDSDILDAQLSEAVKKFQLRHGLEPDGAVGKQTQSALAVPVQARIVQMQKTLEKMRDMQVIGGFGDRYILVNVAGFYLQAVDKDLPTINSKIIVGNRQNHTPLFQSMITEVSFNPPWYVPERIAREEIIQKQREDPEFLSKGNYMVTTRDGKIIDHDAVDWNNVDASPYRFTQRAGEKSALGKVKFNLPDTDNIYLHSTGTPKLFAKAQRAFSHGCIRVEKARELIDFVLKGQEGWDAERIAKFYDGSASRIISVTAPPPVYLVYWTSWVDESSNRPYFYQDIYAKY